MKNTKFIIKLAAILFAIVFVCTLLLVLCNFLTKGRIEELRIETENNARTEVMPGAVDFEKVDAENVTEAYIAKDASGANIGYCFKTEASGFGGTVYMIVGVTNEGAVSGVNITEMAETPGLGAKAAEPKWISQFKGKSDEIKVVKTGNAKGNEINAISGATITSKTVAAGVNKALEAARVLIDKEGK